MKSPWDYILPSGPIFQLPDMNTKGKTKSFADANINNIVTFNRSVCHFWRLKQKSIA